MCLMVCECIKNLVAKEGNLRILLVCRLNKARSLFGAALLTRIYPKLQIDSAGISAVENSQVSEDVINIARKWKVTGLKGKPENLSIFLEEISSFQMIIAADTKIRDYIRNLGYQTGLESLEDSVLDSSFCPVDPVAMSKEQLEIELAKLAHAAIRTVNKKVYGEPKHQIKTFIPLSHNDSELAWNLALFEHINIGGFLVDADFRAPYLKTNKTEYSVNLFDLKENFKFLIGNSQSSSILSPIREYSHSESILTSPEWTLFVNTLAAQAPVVILCAPRFVNKRENPDSYLASALATSISTVGA